MKKVFLLIVSILLSLNALAQLEVKSGSFKEVPGFVNINHDENYQYDDNNLPFAVVKVRTEIITDKQRRELRFESNMATGIVLEYHTGEVWVYLTAKYADYLKISHTDFSSIEFTLPFDLQPKKGYELTLMNKASPLHEGWGSLSLTTTPSEANIILNGNAINQKTPYSNEMMPDGKYEITVSKERYKTITKTIEIKTGENANIKIDMPIDVATITLNADDQTDIYIDGELKHRGSWSGELYSGQHDVVYKKQYHYDAKQIINVEGGENQNLTIDMSEIHGGIKAVTTPAGATVYIDKKFCGVTPITLNDIIIGTHELIVMMEDYVSVKKLINVEEGKLSSFDEKLEKLPDVMVKGVYSVSPTQKVMFSRGNLQYQASTKTWRFADHQWDVVGDDNKDISSDYSGWIDLFGWGTGKNPTKSSGNDSDYSEFNDWGNNNVSNRNDKHWRTLTKDEWDYIMEKRKAQSGVRYAHATVDGVKGLILLPDNWNKKTYKLVKTNTINASFSSNIISQLEWINKFEINGAVFLPVASWRRGVSVTNNGVGFYWLAPSSNNDSPTALVFKDYGNKVKYTVGEINSWGYSVRLVCDVE